MKRIANSSSKACFVYCAEIGKEKHESMNHKTNIKGCKVPHTRITDGIDQNGHMRLDFRVANHTTDTFQSFLGSRSNLIKQSRQTELETQKRHRHQRSTPNLRLRILCRRCQHGDDGRKARRELLWSAECHGSHHANSTLQMQFNAIKHSAMNT